MLIFENNDFVSACPAQNMSGTLVEHIQIKIFITEQCHPMLQYIQALLIKNVTLLKPSKFFRQKEPTIETPIAEDPMGAEIPDGPEAQNNHKTATNLTTKDTQNNHTGIESHGIQPRQELDHTKYK